MQGQGITAAQSPAGTPADASSKLRPSFQLRKWYLDIVAPDGAAIIGYSADLRWGLFHTAYSAALISDAIGATESRSSLRLCAEPTRTNDVIEWQSPRLGVRARWRSEASPVERALLENHEGAVMWRCLMPRARACAVIDGAPPIEGWGYVERLDLTIRPWRLPLRELRWARFLADHASLVWIEWRGPEPRTIVLHDSVDVGAASITDDCVRWDGGELCLDPGRILRRGALGSTVLARLPLLRAITPRSIRAVEEIKSISSGSLLLPRRTPVTGWAIHEVVRFQESGA